jgi:hypothetical protein
MRPGIVTFTLIYLILGMVIVSCNKESSNPIPVIVITSPFEDQAFFIPDTIHIEATISDDKSVNSLQVGLVNSDFVPVLPLIYLSPGNSNYQLTLDLPVSDIDIETGDYYIYIKAEDDKDFKNKYQAVQITGLPKVLERVIVVTHKDDDEIAVTAVDGNNSKEPLFDISSDYASSEVDSKKRQFYLAGANLTDISAYNLDTKDNEWIRVAFPPLPVHSTGCLYFSEHIYASYDSYYIYGFRYNGSQVFDTEVETGMRPSRIMKFQTFLIADLQSKTGGFSSIASYNITTGVEKNRLQITYRVVEFLEADENSVIAVANENEQGVIWLFDPNSNMQSFLMEIPGKILCAVKLTDDHYMLGTSAAVYHFTLSSLSLSEVTINAIIYRLRYDDLNKKIYAGEANRISILSYPEMQIQNTIEFSDSILNFHLLYNK